MGHVQRLPGIGIVAGIGRALIEGHDDIRPDTALNIHHIFRGKKVLGPIDMGFEGHPFLLDFPCACKGKYLISP